MYELPSKGQISYRTDERKLYFKGDSQWEALAMQKDVSY